MSVSSQSEDDEQIKNVRKIIDSDDAVELDKLLRNEIQNQKNDEESMIQLEETQFTFGTDNLLHYSVDNGAVKCVKLLVNAPYSWNVDLPNADGWSSMHIGQGHQNPEIMVAMAPFSAQMRPYPVEFNVFGDGDVVQYISTYLLWPQVALFDQPMRMIFDIKKQIKGTNHIVKAHENNERGYDLYDSYYGEYFGLLCELLLANAELFNNDVMDDNRLPYTRIKNIDSSRMWPIMPISKDFVDEHIDCIHYPRCLERGFIKISPDIWKFHRFGRIETDSTDKATKVYIWNPPMLKEFSRLVIRRCMVRRVEPLNNNSEKFMYPNQAIFLRNLPLPADLKDYMLFTDLPKSSEWDPLSDNGRDDMDVSRVDIPGYGPGTALEYSFIPDSFKSLYP